MVVVAWAVLPLALTSLAYCYHHSLLLLYGDAVAHLHIARRILDSLNPGFRQIGAVWLPLPHLLLLPFVADDGWWRSGLAGAWVSIPAYVLGCAGIYGLARMWLSRTRSIVAVAVYALNPGLLYMATTAMTEPLFLAEMIWAVLLIVQYQRSLQYQNSPESQADFLRADQTALSRPPRPLQASGGRRPTPARRLLVRAGLVLVCAIFTRYDGWVYAAVLWCFATAPLFAARGRWKQPVAGAWVLFTALLVASPAIWLAYNAKQYGDPLDFMRGPGSARAIEAKTSAPGAANHPGYHDLRISALYFLKDAEIGAAPPHLGDALLWLSIAGTAAACFRFRRRQIWPVLIFWLPLPFYAYSVAYGSVPIFIPLWRPFSWYNTRYGMEMLPAFALFAGCFVAGAVSLQPKLERWILGSALLLVALNSLFLLRVGPLVYREAVVNSRTRIPFEHALANALFSLPDKGLILMDTSDHAGAVQRAAIPLRRTVNEGDYLQWTDALADPAKAAPFAVAIAGDPVSQAIERHPEGLKLMNVICSTGQPCARIYSSETYAAHAH